MGADAKRTQSAAAAADPASAEIRAPVVDKVDKRQKAREGEL